MFASPELTPADAKRLATRICAELGIETAGEDEAQTLETALARAWAMGAKVIVNDAKRRGPCRVCGCWELQACEGGCGWAEDGLCTECAPS